MRQGGLKRGWSEMDKAPISEAKRFWAQAHVLTQPNPFHLPEENKAPPWPAFPWVPPPASDPAVALKGPPTLQQPWHLDLNTQGRAGLAPAVQQGRRWLTSRSVVPPSPGEGGACRHEITTLKCSVNPQVGGEGWAQ